MLLQNSRVSAEFSDNNGMLIRLTDKQTGMEFINAIPETACRAVVRYQTAKNGRKDMSDDVTICADIAQVNAAADSVEFCWHMKHDVTVYATASLLADGISFTSRAECVAETQLQMVEYPVIGGMGNWDNAEMIHSFATGMRVKKPMECFKNGEGIRYAPYPECFSGASMQFYAYYSIGKGGLLFMAEDGESHQKWLNLYRNKDGMEGTMMYGFEDLGLGKGSRADYPFNIRFLNGKGWEEAAALYKDWAVKQSWCAMGKMTEREHCDWLLKKVGLSTFGIDASQDRSNYIRHYHQDANTPVFHILGPDWAHSGQSFNGKNPGYSLDGWVPVSFKTETLDAIRDVGDYFAPFEFDLFGHAREDEGADIQKKAEENRQVFPNWPHTYSCDKYHFFMMCPCEKHTHDMHVARDEQIVSECGADAMYYDISANNLLHICLQENHNHPKGGGNVLTAGYKRIYDDTKKACANARGDSYFPVGTEMINEVFLPELDFYQARAGAQPCSSLEMWPYKPLLNDGRADLIPLFAYVYHEYGAVRLDGWGKIVEEVGDLYYDSVAKIYEWGGLYEINHEYAPGEAFNGVETLVEDHYWSGFGRFGYEYSVGRARYIGQFAAMRTGAGNPYLAYGEMMPVPQMEIAQRNKHYYHYNHGVNEIFSGDILLPAVRTAAWKRTDHQTGYAIFLTNTELDEQRVTLTLNPQDYPNASRVILRTGFGQEEKEELLGAMPAEGTFSAVLRLPSRAPVMVELI